MSIFAQFVFCENIIQRAIVSARISYFPLETLKPYGLVLLQWSETDPNNNFSEN